MKEKKFVKEYLKTGNASEAVRRAGYNATPQSVRVIGTENLAKLNIVGLMDKHGVTDELLVQSLKEGLQAWKRVGSFGEEEQLDPDFAVRHKWWNSAMQVKGHLKNEDVPSVTYVQMIQNQNNGYSPTLPV